MYININILITGQDFWRWQMKNPNGYRSPYKNGNSINL